MLKHPSDKYSSHLMDKVIEILMKRYAVEKIIPLRKLIEVMGYAVLSFLIFQAFWLVSLIISNSYKRFLVLIAAIVILSFFWGRSWKLIGNIIPKFVLIGMLGWIFIIVNITPNLIIGDKWGVINEKVPEHLDNPFSTEAKENKKEIPYSISLPISRLFNLNEKELNSKKIDQEKKKYCKGFMHCIGIFISPIAILEKKPGENLNKRKIADIIKSNEYIIFLIVMLLCTLIVFIDLLLTVSTYWDKKRSFKWFCFYSIKSSQRENEIPLKLAVFCIFLSGISYFSLNYFLLFWIISFVATIFLFRWEIKERGQNHKKWSRSILFVFLTQVFSSISGEILFLLFFPLYTEASPQYPVFNLYDSIVLGWIIILGSSVTVFIGIVTQVIWSGRRMTERMKT